MTTRRLALFVLVLVASVVARRADAKKMPPPSLDGTWLPTAAEFAGKPFPEELRKTIKLVVAGDSYTVSAGDAVDRGTVKRNTAAKPKTLDITSTDGPNKGKTMLAIYELSGDTLRVCYDLSGKGRPAKFETTADSQLFLVTYQRARP